MHSPGFHANCLNCDAPVKENFCANCGQKVSTHRYSMRHFLEHDLVHGIWHVDKGLLFTVRELFSRPGHSIRSFIEGKRAKHFNYFTLIVLITGLGYFLGQLSPLKLHDIFPENTKAAMTGLEQLTTKYPKLIPLLMIPISALFSFIWFYKTRLNFTEHIILNAYKVCGELVIGLVFTVIMVFYRDRSTLYTIYNGISIVTTLYGVWFYYQYFSTFNYKKPGLILRSIMIPVCVALFYVLVGVVAGILSKMK